VEFTLHYQGPLKANGSPEDKQGIRRHFHTQLRTFWTQEPLHLAGLPGLLSRTPEKEKGDMSVLVERGGFWWAPLVSSRLIMIFAELQITWLREGPPGALFASGDIDNRLKTLFDALQLPPHDNAIPPGDVPGPDEDPFFVLLEDEKLVSKVEVSTDQLLTPGLDRNEVVLLVHVRCKVRGVTWGNAIFL